MALVKIMALGEVAMRPIRLTENSLELAFKGAGNV